MRGYLEGNTMRGYLVQAVIQLVALLLSSISVKHLREFADDVIDVAEKWIEKVEDENVRDMLTNAIAQVRCAFNIPDNIGGDED